jgi:hypothetical protein
MSTSSSESMPIAPAPRHVRLAVVRGMTGCLMCCGVGMNLQKKFNERSRQLMGWHNINRMWHIPRISLYQDSGPSEAEKRKQSTVAPRWRGGIKVPGFL